MIDVHLSQMQGVVGLVPQPTTTGGGGNGGGNNDNTHPLDYNGFSSGGNQQGPGQDLLMRHPMMRTRMTMTTRMRKTRKRKMTIGHGGDADD